MRAKEEGELGNGRAHAGALYVRGRLLVGWLRRRRKQPTAAAAFQSPTSPSLSTAPPPPPITPQ